MSDSFYRAFEDRYRGSRSVIKLRLSAYLPFIGALASIDAAGTAIDLGCGRGEWLELLADAGLNARGVDIDDSMLRACGELGLNAQRADALESLRDLPAASAVLVSAFHLVEHLPFGQVRALVQEALRVLKPGGLLILETPNPENLVVGATSFYLDPSHIRPIPSELLDFVVEHAGFHRHKIVRLQEPVALHTAAPVGLFDVLYSVSPDYGIVAQKKAANTVHAAFAEPFQAEYGISLGMLAQHYDLQAQLRRADIDGLLAQAEARTTQHVEQTIGRIAGLADQLAQAEALSARAEFRSIEAAAQSAQTAAQSAQAAAQAGQAVARAVEAEVQSSRAAAQAEQAVVHAAQAEARATEAQARSSQAEARAIQAEAQAAQLAAHLHTVLLSNSWRITAPLRKLVIGNRRLGAAIREGRLVPSIARRVRQLLRRFVQALVVRPRLRQVALRVLDRFPGIESRLRRILLDPAQTPDAATANLHDPCILSPRSLRILAELRQAIDARKT